MPTTKISGVVAPKDIQTAEVVSETYSFGEVVSATEPINIKNESVTPEVPDNPLLPVVKGSSGALLKKLFDDEYKDIKLDKDDALRVAKSIHSLRRGGSAGQRLICAAEDCEFSAACELFKTKLGPAVEVKDPETGKTLTEQKTAAPKGKPCPLEEVVVQDARTRYSNEFHDLVFEDEDPKVLEGYINDLCQIEMIVWRCNMIMAYDYSNPLIQTPGAVTSDGRIVWKPEANPILEIQERLQQRKTRILNDLVKTPREKYKKEHAVGIQGDDSLGRRQAAKKQAMKDQIGESIPDALEIPAHVKDISLLSKGKKSEGK